jgi:hypothetical protein
MKYYAVELLPVLDRTRGLFDAVARAVTGAASIDELGQICATYGPQVQVLADQVDGVPHPYPGYTAVGWYHHGLLGIYHRVQGALNLCGTAASNGDTEAASNAIGDITAGDEALRSADDYIRWLTTN